MKICPACRTQYSDDTLRFCLQDGTPLAGGFGTDTPTIVLGETETVTSQSGRENVPYSEQWQQSQVTHVAKPKPEKRGSNTAIAVAATAFGMLLLFGVVGIGAWLFLRNPVQPSVQETGNTVKIPVSTLNPGVTATPMQTATRPAAIPSPANPVVTSPPPVDESQNRSEVSARIDSWKSQAESLNLNAYMSHYAGTVDYYRKSGASVAFVRADKQRAFLRYSSIRVDLSNKSVTIDASGQTATAVFDKEWDFQGNGSSMGKVRQMMRLRKFNGEWLITAEKDLKLYYKR